MSSRCPLESVMGGYLPWGEIRDQYSPCCTLYGDSASRQSAMFWGCIGFDRLRGVPANMNQDDYVNIFSQDLPASAQDIFRQPQPIFVFQDDNAPPHTAKIAVAWISNHPFHHMQWPPYSSDMKIIEIVLGWLMKNSMWILRRRYNSSNNVSNSTWMKLHPMPCLVSITKKTRLSVSYAVRVIILPNTNLWEHAKKWI